MRRCSTLCVESAQDSGWTKRLGRTESHTVRLSPIHRSRVPILATALSHPCTGYCDHLVLQLHMRLYRDRVSSSSHSGTDFWVATKLGTGVVWWVHYRGVNLLRVHVAVLLLFCERCLDETSRSYPYIASFRLLRNVACTILAIEVLLRECQK
jgi:hypothetical protein